MVANNMGHYFHIGKYDQKKKESPLKDCKKEYVTLDEINITYFHMKHEEAN